MQKGLSISLNTSCSYYPYGMTMPGRQSPVIAGEEHRYGFNGMESDDEIKGIKNSYDFGARMYDPRVGRFLSIDNLVQHNSSPYVGMDNNPNYYADEDGNNGIGKIKYNKDGSIKKITVKSVINFYGGGATKITASSIARDIENNLNANETTFYDPVAQKKVPINFKVKGRKVSNLGARIRIVGNKIFGGMKQNFTRLEPKSEMDRNPSKNQAGGTKQPIAFTISYGNNSPESGIESGGNSSYFQLEEVYGENKNSLTSTHEQIHGFGYRNPNNPEDYAHSTDDTDLMVEGGGAYNQGTFSQDNLQKTNNDGQYKIAEGKNRFKLGSRANNRTKFIKKDGSFNGK